MSDVETVVSIGLDECPACVHCKGSGAAFSTKKADIRVVEPLSVMEHYHKMHENTHCMSLDVKKRAVFDEIMLVDKFKVTTSGVGFNCTG